MHFVCWNIFAVCFCQNNSEICLNFIYCFHFINIQCDHGSLSPVYCQKSFLTQQRICLVDRVHVDADIARQLPDGRQGISLLKPPSFVVLPKEYPSIYSKIRVGAYIPTKTNAAKHLFSLQHICYTYGSIYSSYSQVMAFSRTHMRFMRCYCPENSISRSFISPIFAAYSVTFPNP